MKQKILQTYLALHRLYRTISPYQKKQAFYLFGFPRGGTTWISEVLSNDPGTVVIYEPLGAYLSAIEEMGYRRFERAETAPQMRLLRYFDALAKGVGVRSGVLLPGDARLVFGAQRVLVKFIKGMQLVDWFCGHFPPEQVLVIFRHPGAVISSQLKYQGGKETQFYLHSIHIRPHNKPVTLLHRGKELELSTAVEKLAYTYALGAEEALKAIRNHPNLNWVVYEELVLHPEKIMSHLSNHLSLPFSFDESTLKKPSSTVTASSGVKTGTSQLEKWRKHLSDEDVVSIQQVLAAFDLQDLYLDSQTFNHNLVK